MRQYHTGNRGDHWKFSSGSLPAVNERRRELCVLSTANNIHGREGKGRRRATSHDINMFITANIPQAWHVLLCRSADSFHNTDCPPLINIPCKSDSFISGTFSKLSVYNYLFFPLFLAHFPPRVLIFTLFIEHSSFPPTLLILHLRFGAVNSQFIYSSNCRRKLTAVRCDGVWCIMEMLPLWEKCLFKSERACNLALFWNSPEVKGWTPLVAFNCHNPKQVEGSNVNVGLSGKWRPINVSISEGTKPPPVTLK